MDWGEDPFQRAPECIGKLRTRFRLVLAVTLPLGVASSALAAVRLYMPHTGAVGAGMYACIALLGLSLALACALMAGYRQAQSPVYAAAHAVGMVCMNAGIITALALTEMCMLALLRAVLADSSGDAFIVFGGLCSACIVAGLVIGVLSSAGERAFAFPTRHEGVILMLATAAAVLLVAGMAPALAALVAVASFIASATVLVRGTRQDD